MKLLWLLAIAVMSSAEPCLPGQKRYGDSCYQLLNGTMPWQQGSQGCSALGGSMAVPDTLDEHHFIWKLFTDAVDTSDLWIGCTSWFTDGVYTQLDEKGDDCVLRTNWAPDEPSGIGRYSCVQLYRVRGGKWDDYACPRNGSVMCEFRASPFLVPTASCLQNYTDGRLPSHCLTGHLIRVFPVKGLIACASSCRREPLCRSFNLRQGMHGEIICQLNNITRMEANELDIELDSSCKYFNF